MMKILPLKDAPAMPWKNGGGITRELLRYPDSDDWCWRISVAEIERDGAFSNFEGVERWFAVLTGMGVRLRADMYDLSLDAQSAPFMFDGAAAPHCTLLQGATRDLNLMVRKGANQAWGRMQRLLNHTKLEVSPQTRYAFYSHQDFVLGTGTGFIHVSPDTLQVLEGLTAGSQLTVQAPGDAQTAALQAINVLLMEMGV